MQVTIENITPARAAELLTANTNNRPLRRTVVEHYADEMKTGRWLLTHQGIALNCDGTLLDGQHRLAAIVESGMPQRMVVTRGVPSASQIAMDDHAKRSASDSISLDRGEVVTQTTVAIARSVTRYAKGDNRQVSKQEVAQMIDTLRSPLAFIEPFIATKQRGVTAACVWSAVVLAWFYVRDLDRLGDFCRILCGQELPSGDGDKPAVLLREWLLRTGVRQSTYHEAFRKTQRAIVAFMEYHSIGKLYGTSVHYPWPLIDPVRSCASQSTAGEPGAVTR